MGQRDVTPPEYSFDIYEHWNERVIVAHGEDARVMVLDRETAVQAVRDLLKNCVPELVLRGHDYPNQESVTVTVADELDFEIDAAEVFSEPIEFRDLDPLI